jgi:hypothetical protein
MRKMRLICLSAVAVALCIGAPTAASSGSRAARCDNGEIAGGTYNGLAVFGTCTIANGATVTINGDLVVTAGAILNDHAASTATVLVHGNVRVNPGGVLGLGTYAPVENGTTVDGSVFAFLPKTLYLGGMTVHGDVTSIGGGDATRNFPIKDDTIDGNLVIYGWSGLWMGVIRVTVGGNVVIADNHAADTSEEPGSDSTEIMTNQIGGNLICFGNSPNAQVNPNDGGQPNTVAGRKLGECAGL